MSSLCLKAVLLLYYFIQQRDSAEIEDFSAVEAEFTLQIPLYLSILSYSAEKVNENSVNEKKKQKNSSFYSLFAVFCGKIELPARPFCGKGQLDAGRTRPFSLS